MSSDEEEPTCPVLPKDSDRGSSVSSELQDEYEELLRYAVVTPKFETLTTAHLQRLGTSHLSAESSQRKDDTKSRRPTGATTEAKDGRHPSKSVRSSQASPSIVEPAAHSRASHGKFSSNDKETEWLCVISNFIITLSMSNNLRNTKTMQLQCCSISSDTLPVVLFCLPAEELAGRSSSRVSQATERSRPYSPDSLASAATEMFISEANIGKMENILDTWSNNLKSNVLSELRKWKLAFMEQHNLEMKKEKERFAARTAGLNAELDGLKGLLHTYEMSNRRKDEVIVNLSQVLDRQKEKIEKMRTFTHWRLRHTEAKEEAHAAQVAQQHYTLQLKRKVWLGWHSLIQKHWKVKVEQACRARAEEVCARLSTEYEAKLAQHCEAIEKAQAEIQRLRLERERYEESMKKAFMRGVCALNMEALSMFHTTEGRPEQPPIHDQHDPLLPQDEPGSSTLAQLQQYPISSARFSPVHFDRPDPPFQSEAEDMVGSGVPVSRAEVLPPTTVVHSSLPLGGTASSHKQVSGRVVTAGQQKPSKSITARVTARPDMGTAARSTLQVSSVAPPMSSVVVERHHPVTQV
uniref:Centrosomal protein POC5 n=1 Tax=Scophthalmus maximus TaxID=52904 RepID=A0A8D3AC65_SCOMX